MPRSRPPARLPSKRLEVALSHPLQSGSPVINPLTIPPFPPRPEPLLSRPKTGFSIPVYEWTSASPQLDAWRRVPRLREPGVSGARRWAYTVLDAFIGGLAPFTVSEEGPVCRIPTSVSGQGGPFA